MKRLIIIFSIMSLTITALFVTNQTLLFAKAPLAAAETMHSANQLYEAGQFAQAAQVYEQLIDQGYADTTLFYNLGNSYFKQGDFGRAILNYRRAEHLSPRDKDVAANLALAHAQVVDQTVPQEDGETSVKAAAEASQAWFTLNELAIAALVSWIVFAFLLIAWNNSQRGTRWRSILQGALTATTVALIITLFGLGSRMMTHSDLSDAVVVAQEINVTSGPGMQYITTFTLHNGTEVDILEMRDNWVRLALPNNEMQGWVPANAVELVAMH